MNWLSRLKPFVPSGFPLIATLVAAGIAVVGTVISVLYGLSPPGPFLEQMFSMLGFFVLSFTALVIEVAAWIEKRSAPRLTLGCGALLVLSMACGLSSVAMYLTPSEPRQDAASMVMGMLCLSMPLFLIFAIPSMLALIRLRPELTTTVQQEREQRAIQMIQTKGMVTYAELNSALGMREDEIDPFLIKLVQDKKVLGFREVKHKRFYTVARYWEKQSQLLGMIAAKGEVRLEDAALELDAPISLLKEWIYTVVQNGKFTGYINWDKGMLYSADAETLRKGERCPHCGGALGLAGKGVIQCHHCHAEVFLGSVSHLLDVTGDL